MVSILTITDITHQQKKSAFLKSCEQILKLFKMPHNVQNLMQNNILKRSKY